MKKPSKSLVEQYSDKDIIFKNNWIIETPSCNFLNTGRIQYNQKDVHNNSCFVHWPLTAISALTGYTFTLEERKEITDLCFKEDWADPEWWWKFQEACNFIAKWYSDYKMSKDQRLDCIRIWKADWDKISNKWYLIVTWYNVQDWNRADRNDDWKHNKSLWAYWKNYWWHCICIWKVNWWDRLVDNYKWMSYNIVKSYEWLQMYTNWYFFVIKEDVKDWYEWLNLEDKQKKLAKRPKAKEEKCIN